MELKQYDEGIKQWVEVNADGLDVDLYNGAKFQVVSVEKRLDTYSYVYRYIVGSSYSNLVCSAYVRMHVHTFCILDCNCCRPVNWGRGGREVDSRHTSPADQVLYDSLFTLLTAFRNTGKFRLGCHSLIKCVSECEMSY